MPHPRHAEQVSERNEGGQNVLLTVVTTQGLPITLALAQGLSLDIQRIDGKRYHNRAASGTVVIGSLGRLEGGGLVRGANL